MDESKKTFMKVTNLDIYKEMQELKCNQEKMMHKQDMTNGKVKLAMWVATTGLTVAIGAIGFLFQHMGKP